MFFSTMKNIIKILKLHLWDEPIRTQKILNEFGRCTKHIKQLPVLPQYIDKDRGVMYERKYTCVALWK